ncbi:hypothetical protein ABL78_3416 [Leptomonas seymouri]|uniref:CRAL-TRIO domain-containing protein n=1 Tax=Leptomonas seymouri TaxID=5684 RepID=A0A0N1I4U0_LEPSE|nr:hypothetical protein ABL78_3416 [Leptomonas seymouri]|eukprot:KPI87505.1 hypothetical protein ABL78_3416 [Leptomonas seymouri]
MLWKPALDLFMNTLRELFQYYSQCVYQILIVNSPAMVMFAYKIVRGVLPPGVQRKVHIVDAQDTPATMRKFIDEANVPDFYGGTCRCPGGCIEGYGQAQAKRRDKESVSSASEEAANGEVGVVTEDIALKAGQEHRRVFTLKKGETVVWEFVTPSGNGVTFAKYFEPSNEAKGVDWERVHLSKVERYVISKESPSEGSDEYTAGIDGVLVLVWDNKQSWFSAKHLQMKVFKQASEQTSA